MVISPQVLGQKAAVVTKYYRGDTGCVDGETGMDQSIGGIDDGGISRNAKPGGPIFSPTRQECARRGRARSQDQSVGHSHARQYPVPQHADPLDLQLHHVAVLELATNLQAAARPTVPDPITSPA